MPLRRRPLCMRSDACPSVDDAETSLWTPRLLPRPATADGNSSATHHSCKPVSSAVTLHHSTSHTPPQTLWCSLSVGNHFNQKWISLHLLVIASKPYLQYVWYNHHSTALQYRPLNLRFLESLQTTHNFISLSCTSVIATLDSKVPTSLLLVVLPTDGIKTQHWGVKPLTSLVKTCQMVQKLKCADGTHAQTTGWPNRQPWGD
jgi:hypothetical protein